MEKWMWLAVSALLAAYTLLWVQTRRARAMLANLPSYPELPFIGSLLRFYGGGESIFRRIAEMSAISEERAKPFVFWIGPKPILLCHAAEDVKVIANSLIEKPYYYNFGKIWLGDGLVTAPAWLWKRNVKKLAGMFTTSVVEGYQDVFNAQAQALVDSLKTKVGAKPFDAMRYLAYTTLGAVCQTALGVPQISDSMETEKYYQAFNRCLELLIARGLNLLTHLDCLYKLTPSHRELAANVGTLHHVSNRVLEKRKEEREKMKDIDEKEKELHVQRKEVQFRSVLDILLDISESDPLFTEQQIKSEVDTIIVGGQETVASTIFYSLLMIGKRPKVQDKLYAEITNIFGKSKRPVQKEDLARMEYCEAIINETLRLFPPFPVVMRYADKEVKLESCTVPIGTGCAINAWGAGRSRHAWGPDAQEYRPERWLNGEIPSTAGTFLAFSYGRRSCIGKRYAMAILKTVLVYCVRELEFSSNSVKMALKIDIVLRPISGHLIQVKLRN